MRLALGAPSNQIFFNYWDLVTVVVEHIVHYDNTLCHFGENSYMRK